MFEGIITFFQGFTMLLSRATLRAVLWRMIGLLIVLMLVLIGGVYLLADYLNQLWMPEGDAWYWDVLAWIAWALALLLAIVSGVVSFTALATAAVAPWLDTLASRTETLLGKTSVENSASWVSQTIGSLMNSVRPILELSLYALAAIICFWFPPLATAIWVYGSIRFLNFELFDTQASRSALNFKARKLHLAEHKWFWLGFGGTAMVLMMVPVINLLVIPAAVVALAKKG